MALTPGLTFALLLATALGLLAHVIWGGGATRMMLFVLLAWLGFALGHAAGVVMDMRLLRIGSLNALTGGLGALLALGLYIFWQRLRVTI